MGYVISKTDKRKVEKLIYKMLITSTGVALMDSGDAYGRHWQRNQKEDFKRFSE